MNDTLEAIVSSFKEDVTSHDDYDLMLKYIYSSKIWYFESYLALSGDSYFSAVDKLHKNVSEVFDVSFKNMLIVGSAKTGFSLSPWKLLNHFDSDGEGESDLDIAIISTKHFDQCWKIHRENESSLYQNYTLKFKHSVYKGFIPHEQSSTPPFLRKYFRNYKSNLNKTLRKSLSITHDINYRIYRSWSDLHDYHVEGIKKVRNKF